MTALFSVAYASATRAPTLLVAGDGPAIADFLAFMTHRDAGAVRILAGELPEAGRLVVFLPRERRAAEAMLDLVAAAAQAQRPECVCLVSSFAVHCGDANAEHIESLYRTRLESRTDRLIVFRPGHVLCEHSPAARWTRRLGMLVRLIPAQLTSCFVDGDELFAAIAREMEQSDGRNRTFTLLGANRSWRDLAAPPRSLPGRMLLTIARLVLALLLLGPLVAWLLRRLAPRLSTVDVHLLRPKSTAELLALYNPYNARHVKIVGYNNGVVHFGHRYPGRTLVSTLHCGRRARVRGDFAQFDAGVTIRRAQDVLSADGKELQVLPNYSYVSLGTAFFVPIHGSASKYSTVAETIESAILYDPVNDRLFAARAGTADFARHLYNAASPVLVLRLTMKVKPKSRYDVKQETVLRPLAATVWNWFHDRLASNVEVRKAGAASPAVTVYRYSLVESAEAEGLDVPRDRLGRVWDRLEETPGVSWLFHTLSRRLAHHVELFLTEAQFHVFWETHGSQPIAKIQLRFIKQDGYPYSPFRDHDCISADLFMRKKHRPAFEAYLNQHLPGVKMNPGKHSM